MKKHTSNVIFFKVWPCGRGVFCVGDIAAKVFFVVRDKWVLKIGFIVRMALF